MTIHSQEDLHLGNHLLRYLPFSTNASQCVVRFVFLCLKNDPPCFSCQAPHLLQPAKLKKACGDTLLAPFRFLPSSSHSWRVGGVEPTHTFQGPSALTQAMRSCISISIWLVKICLLQTYCAFYLRRTTVRMYLFSIFMEYLGKNTFTQRSTLHDNPRGLSTMMGLATLAEQRRTAHVLI